MPELNERQSVLEWNDTAVDFPEKTLSLHQIIEEQVERTPDNIAVEFEGEVLTYRELNQQANQLAHFLQKKGVGPEVLVGVCMERSLSMIVAFLGILKAGGAYVPLDTQFPRERLEYMLADSQPRVLLTEAALGNLWNQLQLNLEILNLDRDWSLVCTEPSDNPQSSVQPQNLAYVIYTSGSTGLPKGVEVTHHSVVNFMKSMQSEPGITESDTLLAVTTISFDIAALELFLPLTVGARVILASRLMAKTSQTLSRVMTEKSVTIMQAAPTAWRLLLESGWKGKNDLKIVSGGEMLSRDLADRLLQCSPAVWNVYGPTETTIWSTIQLVRPGKESVPIGRPIANTQVYILAPDLQQVAVGETGELYIGGDGLARGYFNKPDITAERFIPNPFPDQLSARIYRTGDLARYLSSGEIEFQGRVDHQIKVHGVRVEPEEIEAPILQFSGIKQVLVVAREDSTGDKRLIAYIIPADGREFQPIPLRNFLALKLPQYLVPSAFVLLNEFPLTFNGKIDRKALPEPSLVNTQLVSVSDGPQDNVEYRLVTIWEDLLRVKPIGLRDNFFDLGGHSLAAARLLARIEQSFAKELSIASLLEAPTIAQQAQLIRGDLGRNVSDSNASGEIPLFYLGGDPTFRPLSQGLRARHAFHSLGIQASIVRNLRNPFSLECIAEHFVHAIRERKPQGPYMLAGWCAHGLLALETAQQLREQGEEVPLVVMLEAANPVRLQEQPRFVRLITRLQLKFNLLEFEYSYVRTLAREQARDYISGRLARKFAGVQRLFHQNGNHQETDRIDINERNLLEVVYAAADNYLPRPYDSPVALVRSRRKLFELSNDPKFGWDDILCKQLEVFETPGNHYTMYIEPNVEGLAAELASRLKTAEQRFHSNNPISTNLTPSLR
jgi:amino acid adenylation domain-containing protein